MTDKAGVVELARALAGSRYQIISTGNTARVIRDSGTDCIEIGEFTGFPEILGGRVKTLNPKVFGGILSRRDNPSDLAEMENHDLGFIDIVACNLYDFSGASREVDATVDDLIDKIDIGGVTLIRAAAKNHKFVTVLTSPAQYPEFLEKLEAGEIDENYRASLAVDAFKLTARYDSLISSTLEQRIAGEATTFSVFEPERRVLRYGENPHQKGYFYGDFSEYFEQLTGKELSYNNILDLNAACELVEELQGSACAIIKHNNPCGAATGSDLLEAYTKALSCDPVSAFGGIVVFNSEVDAKLAEKLNEIFLELVVARSYTDDALGILSKKRQRRVLIQKQPLPSGFTVRNAAGGYLVQERDTADADPSKWETVTTTKVGESALPGLAFAWTVCKSVRSNAIVLVKDGQTIGIGAGQVSRVDSVKIAIAKAREFGFDIKGAVAASDAFFPFEDGVTLLAEAGVKTILQPGGSVRDAESIAAADRSGIAMMFTKVRHFKH